MKRNLLARTMLLSVLASALLSFTACKSDEDKCVEGDQTACLKVLAKAANNMKSALDATESKKASGGPLLSQKMQEKLRSEKISSDELAGYSKADLRILRNAIFASHGYIFKSDDLKEYFAQFDWYNPLYKDVSAQLSAIEKKNIATIKAMEDDDGEGFRDSRDGKTYRYVKIGKQTWMAENLNYKMSGSMCGKNDPNCKRFGRAYTWPAAKKACPSGWHLPSSDEWDALLSAVGGAKSHYDGYCNLVDASRGWRERFDEGSCRRDPYGFSMKYDEDIYGAIFWTSTYVRDDDEFGSYPVYYGPSAADGPADERDHLSVRCVKD